MPTTVPNVADDELIETAWGNAVAAAVTELQVEAAGWVSYTPVLGGGGWAKGASGTVNGAYSVTNDVVHFWVRLVFGTGATFGASPNVPTISLPPFAVDTSQLAYSPRCNGIAVHLTDASAGEDYVGVAELNSTTISLIAQDAGAPHTRLDYVILTVPFAWAIPDVIRVAGWYRR